MGCLALTSRFAEFMDLRVQKQQLLNKDLRRIAVKMLGGSEEWPEGATAEDEELWMRRRAEEDEYTVNRFEKILRQQCVLETTRVHLCCPPSEAPSTPLRARRVECVRAGT